MHTILIVDDESDILDLVEYTMTREGFDVIGCLNTSAVEQILDEEQIDLIIMDRNLPGTEGSTFVQYLRKEGYNQPVIYLSAKDTEDDILEGFDRGGDDYITKPFSLDLLVARVKAVIRRSKKEAQIITHRDICYYSSSKKVFIDKEEVNLTQLERDLLLEFMRNPDILLDRDTLLNKVWHDTQHRKPKTVNVAIKRLKEKIDPTGEKIYIQSVRGEGYILC
ncbi:MAG: response regulator transcription factor [Sulfurovum sp.]|nr:response regulator transcription factor [Sulfurovum sp.]